MKRALLVFLPLLFACSDEATPQPIAAGAGAAGNGLGAGMGAAGAPIAAGAGGAPATTAGAPSGGSAGAVIGGSGGNGGDVIGGSGGATAGAGGSNPLPGVPLSCAAQTTGSPTFADRTDAWELGPMGVNALGNRLSVSDLDHDGYPDLIVHRIVQNVRTELTAGAATNGAWQLRLLMNRPTVDGTGRRFVDATVASDYAALPGSTTELRSANLAVAADVDNDGDLDLFSGTDVDMTKITTDPGDRSQILLNDGTGVFTPAASQPFPAGAMPTTGGTFADVDRDGNIDLFIGFYYQNNSYAGYPHVLYRGAGDGTFSDATANANLTVTSGSKMADIASGIAARPSYGVTSCDLNGDGAPELLVGSYGREWNMLYENDGTGVFKEIGQASGYAGDGDYKYKDNQFFACYCTVNRSTKFDCLGVPLPLVECPSPADSDWNKGIDDQPWRNNGNTFTTLCADLNGDGKNDVYSAMIHHWWAGDGSDTSQILINTTEPGGPITFARIDNAVSGTVIPHATEDWDEGAIFAAAGDLDNDGRTDLLMGETDYPNQFAYLYAQNADGTFKDQATAWSLTHPCASGMAVADFDRDGDLDVILGAGTARDCSMQWKDNFVKLYENDSSTHGTYLAVRVKGDGKTANAAGIGALVTVKTGDLVQSREIGGGYGHMAMQDDTVAFFGLGACTTIDAVTVRWPDAKRTTQTFTNVTPGAFVEITQGQSDVVPITP